MMKLLKTLILAVLFTTAFQASKAQYVDILPYAGYQFAANVDVWYGNQSGRLHFNPAGNYGVGLDVVLPYNDIAISFSFTNAQTSLTYRGNFQPEEELFDVSQQYYMFGVNKEVDMDKIRPFGGLILGWTTINPDDPDEPGRSNVTKFTVGLRGGVKFFISDRIGLFARVRMLLPVQWAGGGIWFGGGGSGTSLSVGSSVISGDIGGGLIISLGSK
jgi:hypothetical protein